jgi:hypothetical protein
MIDLDHLSESLGAPLWLPAGDRLNLSGHSWSSGGGIEHVYLITTAPGGTLRRTESFRQAPGLGHLESMVRDVCLDNRRSPIATAPPRLPDDLDVAELDLAGEEIRAFSVHWSPARITIFRYGPVSVLVGSVETESPAHSFVRGSGQHPISMPPGPANEE